MTTKKMSNNPRHEQHNALEAIERIARQHLRFTTLEARNIDSLDFREVAVWQVREALLAAYEAGRGALVSEDATDTSAHD